MIRAALTTLAALTVFLTACPQNCTIVPPANYTGDKTVATKIGADLSKVAAAPINANFELNYENKVNVAYQQIPEHDVACAMILQSVMCLSQRKDASADAMANNLIKYMSDKNICAAQIKAYITLRAQ